MAPYPQTLPRVRWVSYTLGQLGPPPPLVPPTIVVHSPGSPPLMTHLSEHTHSTPSTRILCSIPCSRLTLPAFTLQRANPLTRIPPLSTSAPPQVGIQHSPEDEQSTLFETSSPSGSFQSHTFSRESNLHGASANLFILLFPPCKPSNLIWGIGQVQSVSC